MNTYTIILPKDSYFINTMEISADYFTLDSKNIIFY